MPAWPPTFGRTAKLMFGLLNETLNVTQRLSMPRMRSVSAFTFSVAVAVSAVMGTPG
jgi:hypothetical protein